MRRRIRRIQPQIKNTESPFIKPTIQTKLKMGKAGDKYEVEADKMADKVVSKNTTGDTVQKKEGEEEVQTKPLASEVTPFVQRMEGGEEEVQAKAVQDEEKPVQKMEEEEAVQSKDEEENKVQKMEEEEAVQSKEDEEVQAKCTDCEKEQKVQKMEEEEAVQSKEDEEVQAQEEEEVQSKSEQSKPSNENRAFESKLRYGNGGQKMSTAIRGEMEAGFGADFNHVRIHQDTEAANMSASIGAQAFTHGNDIYFNKGKYNPNSPKGKHLLAHELTHTIQQKGMVQKKIQRTIGDRHDLLAERFQGRERLEAAYDNESTIRKGSKGADVVILQLALIEAGHPLPNFGADGDFGSETRRAVMAFQRANGLVVDGIVGPRTMEVLDGLFTVGPVIQPVCSNPGVARNVELQPVFFKCGNRDADPTGSTFYTQLSKANEIWSKLGVTFTTKSPVILDDCTNKTNGTTLADRNTIRALRSGTGIEVYFVDNDLAGVGGGATIATGASSNVIVSDFGTSVTLLAHELGHVLGLGHPPGSADAGTIMQPSGSHSSPNPERNTMGNFAFIVFPAGSGAICLTPDI